MYSSKAKIDSKLRGFLEITDILVYKIASCIYVSVIQKHFAAQNIFDSPPTALFIMKHTSKNQKCKNNVSINHAPTPMISVWDPATKILVAFLRIYEELVDYCPLSFTI